MTAALPQSLPDPAPRQLCFPAFSPEFDLLLACCAESADKQLATVTTGINWDRFTKLAQRHGVVPLVYPRLVTNDSLFGNSLMDLRALYQANARQTLWLTSELFRVLEHLKQRNVEVLPYKGPVLSEMLYGNVTSRQFVDLDLLIHAADLQKVKAALAELGYEPSLKLTPREEREYLRSGYEYVFDSPHANNLLEIKWQIVPRFYCVEFDTNAFFNRAAKAKVANQAVLTLSNEDLFLVLCVHAAKHAWTQLSWLCDIARLARTQPLDWDWIAARAKQLRIQRIVTVTLLLVHSLLAAPLPLFADQFAQEDSQTKAVVDQAISILANANEYETESARYFRLMMEAREHWQDRARLLWRLAFTPGVGEWSAIRLPGPLFPLYRLVRVARVAKRLFSLG